MSEQSIRVIAGHVVLPTEMVEQAKRDEQALRDLEHRLRTDPEFAKRWSENVDWDAFDD